MLNDSLVVGFPELTGFEPKCKLCRLSSDAPGLLKLLHRKHAEGLGSKALMALLRTMFDRYSVNMPSLSAFNRHLSGHVDHSQVSDADDYTLPDPLALVLAKLDDEAPAMFKARPDVIAYGHNDSDYHNMAELFRRLMRRVVALDDDPLAFTAADAGEGGERIHNFDRLAKWSGMIANCKSIIESLNKMRNSDRMTVSILEQHTKRYATAVAQPLVTELRAIREQLAALAASNADAHALDVRLGTLLDHQVSEMFTDAAGRTLAETEKHYKLMMSKEN